MTRRIFVDTEWTAPPWSPQAELMWLGLADEAGRTWHGVSADAVINPANNDFVAGVFDLIAPDEPRWPRPQLAQAVRDFCGDVNEFWAWIPTLERFAEWFQLGDEAAALYARWWAVDLQMLQALVLPWPQAWPTRLHDLNDAATACGAELPPRAANHLHPRVHADWNRQLFARIRQAGHGRLP